MSQHDFEITNSDANTGVLMRAAINAALQALASCSAGTSEPTTTYAYQLWADTANNLLKHRNAANDAWITLGALGSAGLGLIDDAAYGSSWDGVTDKTPSKNALYDKIESLSSKAITAFSNLKISTTGTSAVVSVTADNVMAVNSSGLGALLSSVSVSITCSNSGANGLDTGSLAASTWYSVWVIYNGSTVAGLISTSATSPTLPSGYTYSLRVGWIRTDATANKYPLSFIQYGRRAQYKVASGSNVTALPSMASGTAGSMTTPTWVSVAVSNYVPTTASLIVGSYAETGGGIMVAPNNAYGAANSTSNPPPFCTRVVSGALYFSHPFEMILESTNIYWASADSSCSLRCRGWEDNL